MVEAGGGVITNLSSGAAGGGFTTRLLEVGGGFDVSSYYASKAGLEGLTRVTASMGGPHNIRVDAILEGFPSVSREQAEGFLEYALSEALETTPRARTH